MTKLYFAYGSNMNPVQMKRRCPDSQPVGRAKLYGFKLAINRRGVATVIADPKGRVSGVVWQISRHDEALLDIYEGVGADIYTKKIVSVRFENSRMREALIYIDKNTYGGVPRKGYLERIIKGARFFGLDKAYITHLERLANDA